jgi:hypothetical protein
MLTSWHWRVEAMAKLEAIVRTVDGGMREIPLTQQKLTRLYRLQHQGLTGKARIHEWLTDDWGPPPNYIEVRGRDADGNPVDLMKTLSMTI